MVYFFNKGQEKKKEKKKMTTLLHLYCLQRRRELSGSRPDSLKIIDDRGWNPNIPTFLFFFFYYKQRLQRLNQALHFDFYTLIGCL